MSALGDYIHLHHTRYKKFGITRTNPAGGGVPKYDMGVINNRIGNNVKPISSEAIKILEERLKVNSDQQENKQQSEI
jgi:hypothetical protein